MKRHTNKFNRKPRVKLYKIMMRELMRYVVEDNELSCVK